MRLGALVVHKLRPVAMVGFTQAETGKMFGVSQQRVQKIVKKIREAL